MPDGDALLRRFGPGVFAMVAGYGTGWALLDRVGGPLSETDRSSFLLTVLVLSVLAALALDALPLRVARRLHLPRTWAVVAFVASLLLAGAAPLLLYVVHLGTLGALQALVLWSVVFGSALGYLATGVALGRIGR